MKKIFILLIVIMFTVSLSSLCFAAMTVELSIEVTSEEFAERMQLFEQENWIIKREFNITYVFVNNKLIEKKSFTDKYILRRKFSLNNFTIIFYDRFFSMNPRFIIASLFWGEKKIARKILEKLIK